MSRHHDDDDMQPSHQGMDSFLNIIDVSPRQDDEVFLDDIVPFGSNSLEDAEVIANHHRLLIQHKKLKKIFMENLVKLGINEINAGKIIAETETDTVEEDTKNIIVKNLEWVNQKIILGETRTMTKDGRYWIKQYQDGWIIFGFKEEDGTPSRLDDKVYDTRMDAQNAVQDIYERSILSKIHLDNPIVTDDIVDNIVQRIEIFLKDDVDYSLVRSEITDELENIFSKLSNKNIAN